MGILYSLFVEYILIFKIHLSELKRQTPPSEWIKGSRGTIIVIPGFNSTWVTLQTIANHLNKSGYRILVIPQLKRHHTNLEKSAKILAKYIQENNLKDVILISHSKGGLIAKYMMDTQPAGKNVKLSISIAAPYQGSIFGYLRIFSLFELIPDCPFINSFNAITTNNHKIYNLYAKVDNHVLPNKNVLLPGAHNIMIGVIGHTRILLVKQTLDIIDSILLSYSK